MLQAPREIELPAAGRKAVNFVVVSAAPASKSAHWGVGADARTGEPVNVREHAYVVIPMETGFYVLIYPATRQGYALYEPHFNELVNTFLPLKEGPDGLALAEPSPEKDASPSPFKRPPAARP
jgi:hypothetical protein